MAGAESRNAARASRVFSNSVFVLLVKLVGDFLDAERGFKLGDGGVCFIWSASRS